MRLIPVTLPPGRARLATSPLPNGSPAAVITIGMVAVARLAANGARVPAAAMTSTLSRTRSAASSVLALDPSQLPQSIKKNCTKHGRATCAEDAYRISLLGLLCARRERPRGRAAEQDDELSPPHVSRATVWRSLSGWLAALSGYHGGVSQVLGADLKCSESRR